jgi:hypothetical protein
VPKSFSIRPLYHRKALETNAPVPPLTRTNLFRRAYLAGLGSVLHLYIVSPTDVFLSNYVLITSFARSLPGAFGLADVPLIGAANEAILLRRMLRRWFFAWICAIVTTQCGQQRFCGLRRLYFA